MSFNKTGFMNATVASANFTAMHPLFLVSFLASALSVPLGQVGFRHIKAQGLAIGPILEGCMVPETLV